jgi:hypothetical protein
MNAMLEARIVAANIQPPRNFEQSTAAAFVRARLSSHGCLEAIAIVEKLYMTSHQIRFTTKQKATGRTLRRLNCGIANGTRGHANRLVALDDPIQRIDHARNLLDLIAQSIG